LHLVVGAFLRLAFAALERVRRRLNIILEQHFVANRFLVDNIFPNTRLQFLVGHKRDNVRFNSARIYIHDNIVRQISGDASKSVQINLDKILVVPFFDNFVDDALFDGIVENSLFQVQTVLFIF